MFSLAAAAVYAAVFIACLIACVRSAKAGQPAWHARSWLFLAILFALFIVLRVAMLEELMRMAARDFLREQGAYASRRELQTTMIIAFVLLAAGFAAWLIRRQMRAANRRTDIAVKLAVAGGLGIAGLLGLRVISLHMIDELLYGPLKLNWIGDIGLSCAVLFAAVHYTRQLTSLRRGSRR